MRLWNALHTLYRGKKGLRRTGVPRARLEVEALDQRLLPSSVPNLAGVTMVFNPGNTLTIQAVQDQGGGKGIFAGYYADSSDGVWTAVSGAITLKGMVGPLTYDFGVTFSGTAASDFQFNPRTGIWSQYLSRVSASGDFYTQTISGNAGAYGAFGIPWNYYGHESDSLIYNSSWGSYVVGSRDTDVWYLG
jgi:hypothetical protein